MTSSKPNHYVNNKEFYEAIVEHHARVKEAEEKGLPKPRLPNYIGECFLKIATRLSYSPSFINYTYRDEMIADGVENCVVYFHNFNPVQFSNPFAYFTQTIYNAFIRRIERERKQLYIRHKTLQHMHTNSEMYNHSADGDTHDVDLGIDIDNPYMSTVVEKFETSMKTRREKRNAQRKKREEDKQENETAPSDHH